MYITRDIPSKPYEVIAIMGYLKKLQSTADCRKRVLKVGSYKDAARKNPKVECTQVVLRRPTRAVPTTRTTICTYTSVSLTVS